jgi:hypothetical protein
MGSLMAGWSSNPLDAEAAMNRSKSSLTNEEIEAFWRSREKAMEEHLKDAAAQKVADQAESVCSHLWTLVISSSCGN